MKRLLFCVLLIVLPFSRAASEPPPADETSLPAVSDVLPPRTAPSTFIPPHPIVSSASCIDGTSVEGTSIEGMFTTWGFSYIPPDPNCAVGPTHVINATNGIIQWRPKDTPQDVPEFEQPLDYFFGLVSPPDPNVFTGDPKVIYDHYAGRFVLILMGGRTQTTEPWLLAVSKTSDPNDGWWRHTFPRSFDIGGVFHGGDYPSIAVDDDALYLTANMLSTTTAIPFLWIIPKTGAYNGPDGSAVATPYNLSTAAGFGGTVQPAQVFGTTPPGYMGSPFGTFLVRYSAYSSGGIENIRVGSVSDPLSTMGGPYFTSTALPCGDIDDTSVPNWLYVPQPDGSDLIHAIDRRALNAVWRDNSLYFGANCVPPSGPDAGQVTAHWWRMSTTFDGTGHPVPALADQGNIGAEDLGTGTHTFIPAVMPDAEGNLAVGFCASGPTIYAGAYFATRLAGDGPGTIGATCTLAPGVDYYLRLDSNGLNRWGDFTGLALCPVDERTFWIYNEYAGPGGYPNGNQQGLWHTKLGKFHIAQPPVGVTAVSFDAKVTNGAIELFGEFRSDMSVLAVNLYRGVGEAAAYSQIGTMRTSGPGFAFTDHDVTPGATYRYRIGVVDADGEFYSPIVTVSIDPVSTALEQNHPNPFNPVTEVPYAITAAGPVQLSVYDAAGHLVRRLVDGVQQAGRHSALWDGRDENDSPAPSGVYFCRMRAGSYSETRRMVLLK
jgi:hypothetical protein